MGCPHSVEVTDTGTIMKKSGPTRARNSRTSESICSIGAAILIQKWYRRYRARLEVRRRCAWMIYQSLEYAGEQNQLKLYALYKDLIDNARREPGTPTEDGQNEGTTCQSSVPDEKLWKANWGPPCPSNHKGPRITFPLDLRQLMNMLEKFGENKRMHCRFVHQILVEARQVLISRPNIQKAYTSISKQITIVGDLHGQFADLNTILHKNGIPDVTNPYIFNGDFVDRGKNSVEVFLVILYLLVWRPTAVFINRGNHEDHFVNCHYGFIKEIQRKYKSSGGQLVSCFSDLYRYIPLATVIDEKYFVCHGGISNTTDVKHLEKICRADHYTILKTSEKVDPNGKQLNDLQVLLWSDPSTSFGSQANTQRGLGIAFGPDVTQSWLKRNKLSLVIRSHECKDEGYEWAHDGRLLTVFSASNYYADGSNKGAYVKIQADGQFVPFQYTVSRSDKPKTLVQSVNLAEERALSDLRGKISEQSARLKAEFSAADPTNSGKITVKHWIDIMERVMNLKLPWRTLQPRLTQSTPDGTMVLYQTTFEKTQVCTSLTKLQISSTLSEELYKGRDILEGIFRAIDKDNSGFINLDEFRMACSRLPNRTTLDEESIADLAKSIDLNKDGQIDFNEFLEAFRLVGSDFDQDKAEDDEE